MASEPSSRRVSLGTGITCHVLEWNAAVEAGEHTVILIHGFLDTAWTWVPTVGAGLAERFHVVAPEVRGHGDSDPVGPGSYYHFLDYVADLHELIREVGRRRISLVGHSMGGTIAGYYAGAFPDTIHRLALVEGLGPPEPVTPMPERIQRWIAGWRRAREGGPSRYASLEEAAGRLLARDPRMGEEFARELAARATTRDEDGSYRFKHDPLHKTTGPYPFRVDLAQELWRTVTCPVLIVEGADSTRRLDSDDRARRIGCFRDVRDVELPEAGHMIQRHQPSALAALLAEFLHSE